MGGDRWTVTSDQWTEKSHRPQADLVYSVYPVYSVCPVYPVGGDGLSSLSSLSSLSGLFGLFRQGKGEGFGLRASGFGKKRITTRDCRAALAMTEESLNPQGRAAARL
jgi:hypothetical protein